MSFTNILHWSYWFTAPYPTYHGVRAVWITGFAAVLCIGFVALIIRSVLHDATIKVVLARTASLGITMGLIGFLLFSFRQEGIALFSWRIWPLLWLVGVLYWGVKIARYTLRRVPEIKAENKAREIRERYLPKSNR